MSSVTPYFYLAFSNPHKDLTHVEGEYTELNRIFRKAKHDLAIKLDYECCVSFDTTDLVSQFKFLVHKPLALFHFSGHANDQSLMLQDGPKTRNGLLKFFSQNYINLVFLNACNTAGMVEDIFAGTKVQAVLATNRKVNDQQAKQIAIQFYASFITGKLSIENAFNTAVLAYGDSAVSNAPVHIKRGVGGSKNAQLQKLADDARFSWGLFYCNRDVLKMTIDDIIDESIFDTAKLQRQKAVLQQSQDDAIKKAAKLLAVLGSTDELYLDAQADVLALKEQLEITAAALASAFLHKANLKKGNLSYERQRELKSSVEKLNYRKQINAFKTIKQKTFISCTIMGDEYSCCNLLLHRFKNEMDLAQETCTLHVSFQSAIIDDFWKGLARYFDLPQVTPPEVIKKLVNQKYFGDLPPAPGNTHQHVLIQVNGSLLSGVETAQMIAVFWSEMATYFQLVGIAMSELETATHKIALVIIDTNASLSKNEAMSALVLRQNPGLQQFFDIAPFITALEQNEFIGWYEYGLPDSVIDKTEDAMQIFERTSGRIKNVLLHIRAKALEKDIEIPLLNQL